jgi:hypothetical protein
MLLGIVGDGKEMQMRRTAGRAARARKEGVHKDPTADGTGLFASGSRSFGNPCIHSTRDMDG